MGHIFIIISLTNVSTLHSYVSLTFSRFIFLWISSVGVILCFLNKSFDSLFCMTWTLLVFWAEHLPYTSISYLILEYINAKCNSLASLLVIRYFTLLKIPKYLMSDMLRKFTWSLNRKVSSRVRLKWNDFTLLIVMLFVTISFRFGGIGLFIVWNNMKFVLSLFIVNLFLIHHRYKSFNFDATSDISVFKFALHIKRAVSSANNRIFSFPTAL